MSHRSLLVALPLCLLVSGCNQSGKFELVKKDNGEFVRLNKDNGEISIIKATGIKTLPEPARDETGNPIDAEKIAEANLHSLRSHEEVIHKAFGQDKTDIKVRYKWFNGQLYYHAEVGPYAGGIKKAKENYDYNKGVQVHFSDSDGFRLLSADLSFSGLTKQVDNTGKVVALNRMDTIPCSRETFEKISMFTVSWND